MKKTAISMAMCASVLLCMTACQNEDEFACGGSGNGGSSVTLCASFENQSEGGTKTHLSRQEENEKVSWLVHWNEGDEIQVFDTDGNYAAHKTQTSGESFEEGAKAYFVISEGKVKGNFNIGNANYAVYPYGGDDVTLSSNVVTINFPAVQKYVPDSFDNGANVSVGSVDKTDWSILFRNAFGVLKLQLKGNFKVGKIKVTGHSDEKLNGKFNIDLTNIDRIDEPKFKGAVATEERTSGDDVITLDCTGANSGGVQLNMERDTTFYIVVPVDAFKNGFAARVYDADDKDHAFTVIATSKEQTIKRSVIKAMQEKVFDENTPKFMQVEYLRSNTKGASNKDNQMICTNVNANANVEIFVDCKLNSTDKVQNIMGCFSDDNKLSVTKSTNDTNKFNFCFGSAIYKQITVDWSKRHTIKIKNNYGYVDNGNGVKINNSDPKFSGNGSIYIFSHPASEFGLIGNIYSAYIKEYIDVTKEEVVKKRDFIPCKCVSGRYTDGDDNTSEKVTADNPKPGMLDLVSGKLFIDKRGNADFGTGEVVSVY